MGGEPIARITARDFDRARIEILRDLTGVEPADDARMQRSHLEPTRRRGESTQWSAVVGALAVK